MEQAFRGELKKTLFNDFLTVAMQLNCKVLEGSLTKQVYDEKWVELLGKGDKLFSGPFFDEQKIKFNSMGWPKASLSVGVQLNFPTWNATKLERSDFDKSINNFTLDSEECNFYLRKEVIQNIAHEMGGAVPERGTEAVQIWETL